MPILNIPAPYLELNHNKMGMRPRGSDWEWYTAEVGKLGSIHVHNIAPDSRWTYRIRTSWEFDFRETFETKELAYSAAWKKFLSLIQEVIG